MSGRVNIGGVEIDIRADGSLLVADLKRAEAQAKAFANSTQVAMGSVGASVGGLAQNIKLLSASLLTLGVGAGFVGSVKTLAEFGQTMSTVRAITGAAGKDFAALEASAKSLGATTRFSATEAAQGMALLGQAGFTTNEILEAIGPTLDLAQAGGLGLAQAAEISSSTLRGFGLEVSQTARVMDVLAKASVISNADVTSLGEGMKFAAPTAKALGIELEEATATIAKLADAGLTGGLGGRGFQSVATQLVSQRDKIKALIGDYDLATDGISGVIRKLTQAGITTDQVIDIFRGENLDVFSVLQEATKEAGKGLDAYTAALKNSEGTARDISKVMDENLNGAILQASSSFEALVLAIGDAGATQILIGIFRGIGDALSYVSGVITDLTRNALEKTQDTADKLKIANAELIADTDKLKAANENLATAIASQGVEATNTARLEVNAINTRILKNKELASQYAILAKAQLSEVNKSLRPGGAESVKLDQLLYRSQQGFALNAQGKPELVAPGQFYGFNSNDPARINDARKGSPTQNSVFYGQQIISPGGLKIQTADGEVLGGFGDQDKQIKNTLAIIDLVLEQKGSLSDFQKEALDQITKMEEFRAEAESLNERIKLYQTGAVDPKVVDPPKVADTKTPGAPDAPKKKALEFQIYTSALEGYRAALDAINAASGTEEEKSRGRLAALIAYNDAAENSLLVLNELAALNASGDLLPDQNRVIQKILDDQLQAQLKDSVDARLDFSDSDAAFEADAANASARIAAMAASTDPNNQPEGYWDGYSNDIANATKRGLYDAISTGDYGDLLENVIGDAAADGLSRAVDQMVDLLFDLLSDADVWKSVFGGKGVGDFSEVFAGIAGFFGGNMASGGEMRAGRAYRVGEMGAELFVPRTDGFMIPNQAAMTIGSGGADRNIVQVGDTIIHVGSMGAGVTIEQLERTLAAHRRELPQAIDARIANRRIVGAY